jgi:hypothetical protein
MSSTAPDLSIIAGMDTRDILLAGAVAAMVPVIQNAAIDEPLPAYGIEADKSIALACAPKKPAQHHVEHDTGIPMYQATIGIAVTPTYSAPAGMSFTTVP